MSGELFVSDAEDERGPHRRCTGHVTGSSDDLVTCPNRATRVIYEDALGSFACDDPGHIGNADQIIPIGPFFAELHMNMLAYEAEAALANCVEPE